MQTSLTPVSTSTTGLSANGGADQITPSSISNFNAAISSGSTGSAPAGGNGPTAELTALIKQLIPLLQQLLGGNQGGSPTGGQATPSAAHEGGAHEGAAHEGAHATSDTAKAGPAHATEGGADQLSTLLPQLISLLQKKEGETTTPKDSPETQAHAPAHADGASADGAKSDLTSLLTQLIALLEKILGTGGSSEAGKPGAASKADSKTADLVKELIAQLQPQAQGGSTPDTPTATNPATGTAAKQPDYTPGMGISGAEVNAMIAAANGTGPELTLSDWNKGTPTYMTASPTAGGQVANLGSQVGNEAA